MGGGEKESERGKDPGSRRNDSGSKKNKLRRVRERDREKKKEGQPQRDRTIYFSTPFLNEEYKHEIFVRIVRQIYKRAGARRAHVREYKSISSSPLPPREFPRGARVERVWTMLEQAAVSGRRRGVLGRGRRKRVNHRISFAAKILRAASCRQSIMKILVYLLSASRSAALPRSGPARLLGSDNSRNSH